MLMRLDSAPLFLFPSPDILFCAAEIGGVSKFFQLFFFRAESSLRCFDV